MVRMPPIGLKHPIYRVETPTMVHCSDADDSAAAPDGDAIDEYVDICLSAPAA